MVNIDKMREALTHLQNAGRLMDEADTTDVGLSSSFAIRDATDDLEMDIARAESGTLDDDTPSTDF